MTVTTIVRGDSKGTALRVLIAGGGVAAVETLLALRAEAGARVSLELLSPRRTLVLRPLAVAEPFGRATPGRFDLAEIARDHDAALRHDGLARVRADAHEVETANGERLAYDRLVIAVGARAREALPGALTFGGPAASPSFVKLLRELERGALRRVAFAVPTGAAWPLPLYELALLTADHLARGGRPAELVLATPEPAPLAVLGPAAADKVAELLAEAGVELHTGRAPAAVVDGGLELEHGETLAAGRVVAVPRLEGSPLDGVPHDGDGFVPVDGHARVEGLADVYAAGDVTTHPVKQGGLAAQQADAAAAQIAADAGARVVRAPYAPQLRAVLLTGRGRLYVRGEPDAATSEDPLWRPAAKVAGRHLAAYLRRRHPEARLRRLEDLSPARAAAAADDHGEALELALEFADAEASWGDYATALRWLEAAEDLELALPVEYVEKRRAWGERSRRSA